MTTTPPTPNPKPMSKSRSAVPRHMSTSEEVRLRRAEYMTLHDFKIYVGTWNVNSIKPENICLNEWLHTVDDTPDIYAIGLQEITMDANTIFSGEKKVVTDWISRILEGVHPNAEYEELKSVRFVGMQLMVLVKKELKSSISECMTAIVARGAGNYFGNKGGVGISFCFHESLFCFVNSHFAAHQDEFEHRNADFQEITRQMLFIEEGNKSRRIREHDHIFWFGDLNYRVDVKEFPNDDYNYENYILSDQLFMARTQQKAFNGYQEGLITFNPTYKFDKSSYHIIFFTLLLNLCFLAGKCYDKLRIASWCDRILWRSKNVTQTIYDSCPTICLSDHKPVFGYFLVTLEVQDQAKLRKIVGDVLRNHDKRENDLVPTLKVAPREINFGTVKVNDTIATTIELLNVGYIPVVFQLKNKTNQKENALPSWIQASAVTNCLLPGQKFNITFTVKIDSALSNEIIQKFKNNPSIRKIPTDTIIIHVLEGSDTFLTVYFELKPSCFGATFEQMCKLSKPFNKSRLSDFYQIEEEEVVFRRNINPEIIGWSALFEILNENKGDPSKRLPKEIFLLINYLNNNIHELKEVLAHERLTTNCNSNKEKTDLMEYEINNVRDYLDSWGNYGTPFPGTPESAFETLLKLFQLSSVPLLTLTDQEIIATNYRFDLCMDLIMHRVFPLHRRIFLYLWLFIREIKSKAQVGKLCDLNIALTFARVLMRENKNTSIPIGIQPATANDHTYNVAFLERKRKFLLQFFTIDPPMDWVQKELFK
uniref:CSON015029 protein n=1 Tax=Culicoides sonorensis TaxID=179676 RepID=A0A336LNP7_CULSO